MRARFLGSVLIAATWAASASAAIPQSVIASGGIRATSTNYAVHGTVGQPVVGTSANAVQQAFHAYWFRSSPLPAGVDDGSPYPKAFALAQAYPNPFRPRTTIAFALPRETFVQLRVFDAAGAQVAQLVNQTMPAGWHRVGLDARDLASGVYFYQLVAPGFRQAGRLVVLR